MEVTKEQLKTLCNIAEAAGREVMAVYAGEITAWEKDDTSPLTEADLRADRVIREGLEDAFPGVFILSEESSSGEFEPAESFFLVDPLDGTKEFLKRNDEFTVNIALIHQGQVLAGVVLAPALNECFYAATNLGAWKRSASGTLSLQVAAYSSGSPLRIISSRSHSGEQLGTWLAGLPVEYSLLEAGSSLKFCRIAEGQADLYPRFGPTSQWDTAAAQCVLEVAGGIVTDLAGQPLRYGLEREVLNPEFMAFGGMNLAYRSGLLF